MLKKNKNNAGNNSKPKLIYDKNSAMVIRQNPDRKISYCASSVVRDSSRLHAKTN